ncbi:hypothetical protein ACVI1L_004873 [Bradyrhizobium sp. USDA 4516]
MMPERKRPRDRVGKKNLVIRDGLLDDMPKVYKVVKGGSAVEKFVLTPDRTDGGLDRHKNRTLFYSGGDKIKVRLPNLISQFQVMQRATMERAVVGLVEIDRDRSKAVGKAVMTHHVSSLGRATPPMWWGAR